jgi:outer membrane protein OmpA-like peptidoglycan-associated protein
MKAIFIITFSVFCGFTLPIIAQDSEPSFKSAGAIIKEIAVEGRMAFGQKSLPFKINSTDLATDEAHLQVMEIAKALKKPVLKNERFLIEGHTCDLGSADYNLVLSKQRADFVKALLLRAGISADRLVTNGCGEKKPSVPNTTDNERAQNRRVELMLIK